MKLGITGTCQVLTVKQNHALHQLIRLAGATELHHGDCKGADAAVHTAIISRRLNSREVTLPGIRLIIHPPASSTYQAFCEGADEVREPLVVLFTSCQWSGKLVTGTEEGTQMTEFMETRVADSEKLAELAEHALEHNFNRQLTHPAIARLDPAGYHILTIYVLDHNRLMLPGDASLPADPMHHRARVFMKLQDVVLPAEGWLDVTEDDWQQLMTLEQAKG